jgi:16S rRNA (uracil1498-N3)-methyltransferase
MRRFFVPPPCLENEVVSLPDDTAHHIRSVLRLAPGDEIILLDGQGLLCRCRLETLDKRSASARILESRHEKETAFPIQLLQALPKGDKMDLVLQKGTELGVSAFSPMVTERSLPGVAGEREEKRRTRWERIISEAARQSRRPVLPRLDAPLPLVEALSFCDAELRLMLWEEESRPMEEVLSDATPLSAAILVGPEGGFSQEEAKAARAAGFIPVCIGPRILRSETAGFAVASILQYLFGDLGSAGRTPESP